MNYKVVSMPLKPKIGNSGYMILPLITQVCGDMLDSEKVLALNVIHGFSDSRTIEKDFVEELKANGICFDSVMLDAIFWMWRSKI